MTAFNPGLNPAKNPAFTPGGFIPAGDPILAANPEIWLRTDVGLTVDPGVSFAWEDQSGNGNDGYQDVVSRIPDVVSGGLNGKDYLDFPDDGGGAGSHLVRYPQIGLNGTSSMSIFAVMQIYSSGAGADAVFGYGNLSGDPRFNSGGATFPDIDTTGLGFKVDGSVTEDMTDDTWHVFSIIMDGSNWATQVDGAASSSGSQTGNFTTSGDVDDYSIFGMGSGGRALPGALAEFVTIKSAVSDGVRDAITSKLTSRWGL